MLLLLFGLSATGAVAPPTITGVSPSSGTTEGGTSVTISGTGLTGATVVTFGIAAAASFTVVNANTIIAVTPAHAAGLIDVSVTTPTGGTVTSSNAFTFKTPGGLIRDTTGYATIISTPTSVTTLIDDVANNTTIVVTPPKLD